MKRKINEHLSLVTYYPNEEETLLWYQDKQLVKQIDNKDELYDLDKLHRMYNYLNDNGDCFYIEYDNKLIGDCTLLNNGEIAIVIIKEYQNKHIGRLCIKEMVNLAKEKGTKEVKATIYSFNIQTIKCFKSVGFKQIEKELYLLNIN